MISDGPGRSLPEHIRESLGYEVSAKARATRICLFNFEASNIAADAVSSYVFSRSNVQVHTIVDRVVPAWVDKDSDVIIMSYSGNSPEIDHIYADAKGKGARIHCITSGGGLAEISGDDDLILIPKGLNNFDATGYEIGVLVNLYDAMGIGGIRDAMETAIPRLMEYRDEIWNSKTAWKLSVKLSGRIPVIYSVGELRAVHKRWKMLINQVIGSVVMLVSVIILLSLVLMQAFHVRAAIRPRNSFVAGMIAGTMATTTGMSGPPLILYFSHAKLTPTEIRAVACTFFAVSNILALTAFYLGGVDFSEALHEVPYILPGLALGVATGAFAAGRVPAKEFRQALYVILVAMCLHTIWTAARALL